uniref:Translation initiation factor eIF2B subunit epsilon n=1 Tax=Spongospora subterranea TaxID=70186 RepID=A0A0H5RQ68_9EUKA|eukprot:CRZ10849.1 hypothetical protein [Spongospora subterranea]
MSRRKKSAGSSGKSSQSDLKAEVPLQALVLADSFYRRFSPLTKTRPKALLPLVNLPLITYALHFLHRSGVNEAFIVVRAFPAMIREHCQQMRASFPSMRMTILMVNESCSSVGDVLRHVHQLEIIRSDPFIFMGADTVADIDMAPIIADHAKRAATDPDAVMTVLLKPASRKHRIRPDNDNLVVAIASESNKLLAYRNAESSKCSVISDIDVMIDNAFVNFHSNMLNTCIYVCSPNVLTLFNDQFDLQNIEVDFFSQVLGASIMGTSVFAHVINDQYAARVDCIKAYDAVSRDIIERWAFGFAVDGHGPGPTYTSQRLNIFKESPSGVLANPRIAQSSVMKKNSVIGGGCVVGARTYLEDTVLDRNVLIGDDVYCKGSYLWSGTNVGDRAVIDRAIISHNVIIGSDANIGRGAVIGEGVRIGRGVQIPPYTSLWIPIQSRCSGEYSIGDGLNQLALDCADAVRPIDLGVGGAGIVYVPDDDDFVVELYEDEEENLPAYQIEKLRLARISSNSLASDEAALAFRDERIGYLESVEDDNESVLTFGSEAEEETGTDLEIGGADASNWDEESYNVGVLYREIKDTIARCKEQNIADKDDILLEVANLKIADNASLSTYALCVFVSVFDLIDPTPEGDVRPSNPVLKSLSRLLKEWNFLLEKYGQGSNENYLLFIKGLAGACTYEDKPYMNLFPFALQALYQLDAISGDAILEWAALPDQGAVHANLVASIATLLDYLAEEDDDDEASSGESDSD